jgi:AcrR family transcriptional regulator
MARGTTTAKPTAARVAPKDGSPPERAGQKDGSPPERAGQKDGSPRRQARRAELLDAALRVIRRGHGRVAMEDIAAEAGISRPILYRHFGDASGLYAAVADHFCQELLERLRKGPAEMNHGRDLLRHQVREYLAFIAAEPDVYRFLKDQTPPDRPRSITHGSGFSRLVANATARALREAGWEAHTAMAGADLFVGGLESAASRWVEEPTESYEELANRLSAVLWNGFQRGGARVRAEPVRPARARRGA